MVLESVLKSQIIMKVYSYPIITITNAILHICVTHQNAVHNKIQKRNRSPKAREESVEDIKHNDISTII